VLARLFAPERLIWWLLALATVLRVAALADKGVTYDGGFEDAMGYMESARVLTATGRFTFYGAHPSAVVMPGMVLLLSSAWAVTPTTFTAYLVAKLMVLVCSVASVYVLYLIGRRIGGTWVGVLSAAALTVSFPHLYAGTLTLTENPFLFAFLLLTWCTIRLADKPGYPRLAACVAAFCAAVYLRQAAVGFLLPAIVYLLIRRYPWRQLVAHVAVTVAAVALVMAPWWVHNHQAFGEFIAFTTGAGSPFLEGTYQRFDPYDGRAFDAMDALLVGFEGTEFDKSRLFTAAARERLATRWAENPTDVLYTYVITKPASAWLLPFYWDKVLGVSGYWVLRLHALASVLGIVLLGVFTCRSKSRPEFALLALNVVLITAGAGWYLGLSRYVYPYAPFTWIALAYFAVWAASRFKRLPEPAPSE